MYTDEIEYQEVLAALFAAEGGAGPEAGAEGGAKKKAGKGAGIAGTSRVSTAGKAASSARSGMLSLRGSHLTCDRSLSACSRYLF